MTETTRRVLLRWRLTSVTCFCRALEGQLAPLLAPPLAPLPVLAERACWPRRPPPGLLLAAARLHRGASHQPQPPLPQRAHLARRALLRTLGTGGRAPPPLPPPEARGWEATRTPPPTRPSAAASSQRLLPRVLAVAGGAPEEEEGRAGGRQQPVEAMGLRHRPGPGARGLVPLLTRPLPPLGKEQVPPLMPGQRRCAPLMPHSACCGSSAPARRTRGAPSGCARSAAPWARRQPASLSSGLTRRCSAPAAGAGAAVWEGAPCASPASSPATWPRPVRAEPAEGAGGRGEGQGHQAAVRTSASAASSRGTTLHPAPRWGAGELLPLVAAATPFHRLGAEEAAAAAEEEGWGAGGAQARGGEPRPLAPGARGRGDPGLAPPARLLPRLTRAGSETTLATGVAMAAALRSPRRLRPHPKRHALALARLVAPLPRPPAFAASVTSRATTKLAAPVTLKSRRSTGNNLPQFRNTTRRHHVPALRFLNRACLQVSASSPRPSLVAWAWTSSPWLRLDRLATRRRLPTVAILPSSD